MARKPQYSNEMSTSSGAAVRVITFLAVNSALDNEMSARIPRINVVVDSVNPMMVRY